MESKINKNMLEIPSNEAQAVRKEALVEKMLNSEKPTITSTKPSNILEQVKSFIPRMKSANDILETVDKSAIQIDGEPDEDEPYVEMNVQVFEESGTSDSDTDSTDSTISPDTTSSDEEEVRLRPPKQRKLITELVLDNNKA